MAIQINSNKTSKIISKTKHRSPVHIQTTGTWSGTLIIKDGDNVLVSWDNNGDRNFNGKVLIKEEINIEIKNFTSAATTSYIYVDDIYSVIDK